MTTLTLAIATCSLALSTTSDNANSIFNPASTQCSITPPGDYHFKLTACWALDDDAIPPKKEIGH